MNRAYSLLEIKEMDDDARTITGVASTISPDRMGDVVDPMGAEFKLPLPLLWQHDSRQPIGHVTDAKVTKTGITVTAQIAKGVSDQIDQAWSLIKSGLVRGLSIGFRGLDVEQIPNSWGVIFKSWEWLELSAVTIPANAEASIQTIKSIDAPLLAATGKEPKPSDRPAPPGVTGKSTKPVKAKEAKMTKKSIADQIRDFEATRGEKSARMDAIMDEAAEKGETLDAAGKEEYDGLEAEVKEIDEHIVRLKRREESAVLTARAVSKEATTEAGTESRTVVHAQVRATPKAAPGVEFARLAKVKALAHLDRESTREVAKSLYGENSPVYRLVSKANVVAGASVSGNWAEDLVGDETSVYADFVEFLRPMTILGKFGTGNIPSLRQVPFRTPLIGQTGGGQAYWVGEGKPKPLTALDFSRTTLDELKVATISVVTEELLRKSSPSADTILRDALAAAVAERIDIDFIDPAKSASAGVSPASITNGVTPIAATGTGDADDIRADVRALMATYIAANNPPTSGVWVMSSTTALALSLMQNPLGQSEFPGINMNGGTFLGMPAIVSEYFAPDTAGGMVALVNAKDIYFADEGGVQIDVSREASLQMLDNPTNDVVTPTATAMVSMWQTNSVAFRAERFLNWSKRRTSAVALLNGVSWGAA